LDVIYLIFLKLAFMRPQFFAAGSTVMSVEERCALSAALALRRPSATYKLLFRASRDGATADVHHTLCCTDGGSASLLTIIEDTTGKVFGGQYQSDNAGRGVEMIRIQGHWASFFSSCSLYGQLFHGQRTRVAFGGIILSANFQSGVNDDDTQEDTEEDSFGFLSPYKFRPVDVETWAVT
jgi:hypothetical protein